MYLKWIELAQDGECRVPVPKPEGRDGVVSILVQTKTDEPTPAVVQPRGCLAEVTLDKSLQANMLAT